MDCLTKQQILEYHRGNRSAAYEAHLADCASCRAELLKLIAEENPGSFVSAALAAKTIDAIASKNAEKGAATLLAFRPFDTTIGKLAAAACLAVAIGAGYFLVTGPLHEYTMLKKTTKGLFVHAGKNAPAHDTAFVVNRASPKNNAVLVFDSMVVRVGKIPVARDREALVRFGEKTGIEASPAAVINVKARTDTTALIELTKGTALFSIEKNKYRAFVVSTPTARIVAIGTVFSVMADSSGTMINVIEGSVRLEQKFKTGITAMLTEGNGAYVNRDSIINVMIENSQTLKAREKVLHDYIEGTLFPPHSGELPGSSDETPTPAENMPAKPE